MRAPQKARETRRRVVVCGMHKVYITSHADAEVLPSPSPVEIPRDEIRTLE
jgi:hypothetical protein